MQIIINSVYVSSDDVNGWTQVRSLAQSLNNVCGGFFDDDEKRARVCTKNDEQCLIYAFSIWRMERDGKTFQAHR